MKELTLDEISLLEEMKSNCLKKGQYIDDKAYTIAESLNAEDYHQYMIIEHDNKNDIDCPIARKSIYKTQGRVLKRGGK